MITDIYYFLSIFLLFNQLKWIFYPNKMMEEYVFYLNLMQNTSTKELKITNDHKFIMKMFFKSIFIVLWIFFGFFTQQWVLFLFLLIFQFIIIHPISKLIKNYQNTYIFFHWFNSFIGFISIFFIILNQYRLHIDFTTPFMNFIIQIFKSIF